LSDSLKGKQGRFRQNLLGKRVDYSARSVIVVGPELKLYECGLPKDMAAELYKPFIIRKLIERGIVKTVKSAKKIIDRREPVVWDILENVLKGHPVMLNRAPTLHRLGIQAFQPKLIEGKAIQLHPLTCTAFNADFDGDQMAVHLPLGPEAILEAQLLMLGSHNILNPANGSPITVPSQDMVLGLYYMTKSRKSSESIKLKGEGLTFYSPEEVNMAYNEKIVDLNAIIKCRIKTPESDDSYEIIETTPGRVFFNEVVPEKAGFFNEVLTKKNLREIIGQILHVTSVPETAEFLDEIKDLGYSFAFRGGLSFSLGDIIIPEQKQHLINDANNQVDGIIGNYNMGLITNNERYNQVIDVWTSANATLTELAMKQISEDQQGFNSVYMMLDSGARGSKEQIRQLTGMRGLMAKPKKSNVGGGEIIENPILSNFKEGLSILEYFISTHGARKGLADTALKTADAGYLTRRLVDVSQDVIVNEFDCGTLRGIEVKPLKKNEEVVETIGERILGRVALNDIVDPSTNEILIEGGKLIDEKATTKIENTLITSVDVRSALTCETKRGICASCYGRNLATGKPVQIGEAVGVVAAQSIGEPGTQLTLRTFHVGGVAGNISEENSLISRFDGLAEIEDLKVVKAKDNEGKSSNIVISRTSEIKILDSKTKNVLSTKNIPYGSYLNIKNGQKLSKGDVICQWDPFNGVIVSEFSGKIVYENIEVGQILVQENDFIKAGMPLSDGSITPNDILNIKGPSAVQQYLVNEVQEVYRLQGVKINDKHFEVVVRQMMRKVKIIDPGDTLFLEDQLTYKDEFISQNDKLYGMKVIEDAGDSENLKVGQVVSTRTLRDENSILKRGDLKLVDARDAKSATASTQLQGITRASLQTKSFISAASFQETTKVLNEAAVNGKNDTLEGLKENVIVGHRIPAGTGMRKYDEIIVGPKDEYNSLLINKEEEELNY
jgi:DNA-directed RNA polymerase subunit beta'